MKEEKNPFEVKSFKDVKTNIKKINSLMEVFATKKVEQISLQLETFVELVKMEKEGSEQANEELKAALEKALK